VSQFNFLASFFLISTYPSDPGRISAIVDTLNVKGKGEFGRGTVDEQIEFIKSAFPDVFQDPASILG